MTDYYPHHTSHRFSSFFKTLDLFGIKISIADDADKFHRTIGLSHWLLGLTNLNLGPYAVGLLAPSEDALPTTYDQFIDSCQRLMRRVSSLTITDLEPGRVVDCLPNFSTLTQLHILEEVEPTGALVWNEEGRLLPTRHQMSHINICPSGH